jgi:CDP-diglyceride synthetase
MDWWSDSDTRVALAVLAVVGFFGFALALVFLPTSSLGEFTKGIILMMATLFGAIVKDVYAFYFGSSSGSTQKNALIAGKKEA